jgi:hypothetical protein
MGKTKLTFLVFSNSYFQLYLDAYELIKEIPIKTEYEHTQS